MKSDFKEGDIVQIVNANSPYSGQVGVFKGYINYGLHGADCIIQIDSGKSEGPSSYLQLYDATELELVVNGLL